MLTRTTSKLTRGAAGVVLAERGRVVGSKANIKPG